MNSIGILIGVSDYNNLQSLSACKNDVAMMKAILDHAPKFQETLVVASDTKAAEVKSQIADFIADQSGSQIDEVVFYFSGHGLFDSGEFYYLFSDYDQGRKKQTSLENSELDNLLRSLKPSLTVKIVDACGSGQEYIKDPKHIDDYLKNTKGEFANCYFLFSSLSTQASHASAEVSHFTQAIMDSVVACTTPTIRYKAVIDFVADRFENNTNQKPFFVTQAAHTEVFCSPNQEMKTAINSVLGTTPTPPPSVKTPEEDEASILKLIQQDAKRYCDERTANLRLKSLKERVESFTFDGVLPQIFDPVTTTSELPGEFSVEDIGQWLSQRDHEYFAEVDYEITNVQNQIREAMGLATGQQINPLFGAVRVAKGFHHTEALPYHYIRLDAVPKFESIHLATLFIVPLVSSTELRLFTQTVQFRKEGWRKQVPDEVESWRSVVCDLCDEGQVTDLVDKEMNRFSQGLKSKISSRYFSTDTSQDVGDESTGD